MEDISEIESQDYFGDENATFGDRVAAARRATGLTQAQLAQKMGIKLKTLVGWEEDTSEPRANKLQMLAGMVNVSIIWLLTGVGDDVRDPWREDRELDNDQTEILSEFRTVQSEYLALGKRLAQLEKRLSKKLSA